MSEDPELRIVHLTEEAYERLNTLLGDGHAHTLEIEHIDALRAAWGLRQARRKVVKWIRDQIAWIIALGATATAFGDTVKGFMRAVYEGFQAWIGSG